MDAVPKPVILAVAEQHHGPEAQAGCAACSIIAAA
jgi:hypothetical protein